MLMPTTRIPRHVPEKLKASLNYNTGEPAIGEIFEPYPLDAIKSAAAEPAAEIEWKSRIVVAGDGGGNTYIPGKPIRIYNDSRSATYTIVSADHEGGRLWLTLDATALLAQGPVTRVEDSQVHVGSFLTFADGTDAFNRFAGAWLGDEHGALSVNGAVRASPDSIIQLRDPLPASRLNKMLNKPVHVWQYGIGDQVEAVKLDK
jgi:hypothetical protein